MKKFYIGLSRNKQNKIGSVTLQKFMGTKYSHTFIEYDTMRGVDDNTIFHSSMSGGVAYWSNNNFEKTNIKTCLYELEVSDQVFRALRVKVHSYAGNHYAWWQNIGILMVDICKNMGFDIKNPFTKNENCSELVFLVLIELHPELKFKYNPNTIRPDHIEEIMKNYSYKNLITAC